MNRYIAAGFLAAVVALLGSGLDSFGLGLPSFEPGADQDQSTVSTLGTQPIQQAGRVVQPESTVTSTVPTATFDDGRSFVQETTIAPQNVPSVEIGPQSGDVIPRTGQVPAGGSASGDISPIQPDLVQPGTSTPPGVDPDLDSIPALW